MKRMLGLYVHIPFCRSKCDYCDFYSISGDETQMRTYHEGLTRHLKEAAVLSKGHSVDTIYFGGGTPSYYGEHRLRQLLKTIGHAFSVHPLAEITLEANPDSVTETSLAHLRKAGFNRISIGMQSDDNNLLQNLNRPHTFEQTQAAVKAARKAKFENLSLDLMYGLPGQTPERWRETLNAAISLAPEHLSCYGLKLEEGTPLHARRDTLTLPDDDMQADMYLETIQILKDAGYEQYEISNFAKPGFASRHNMKYWKLEEYLGFGPGAHSDCGGYRYSFVRDLAAYVEGIHAGASVIDTCEFIPKKERHGEYLMLRLRTTEGIAESEYARPHAMRFEPLEKLLQTYQKQGWAVCENGRWHFTPQGFLLSNQLIGQLIDAQEEVPIGNWRAYGTCASPSSNSTDQASDRLSVPASHLLLENERGKRDAPITGSNYSVSPPTDLI